MDIQLALMSGIDIPVPEFQTTIHQPSIKEISFIGEKDYFLSLQLICFNKDTIIASIGQGKDVLYNMNDFQIFMKLIDDDQTQEKQNNVLNLLTLFFPKYTASILPNSIYFNCAETKTMFVIDENNFNALKNILSKVGGLDSIVSGDNGNFNPKGEKAAEIAAKLMRGRERVAKSKGQTQNKAGGTLERYVSILTVGLNSMSLNECLNLTVYQIYDLMERFGLHSAWDIDIRSRLAGGKPEEKPEDWMKSLH